MNCTAPVLVVLVIGSAASGCRKEVAEPDDQKSVGQEIEKGLHDADDDVDVDEATDENTGEHD